MENVGWPGTRPCTWEPDCHVAPVGRLAMTWFDADAMYVIARRLTM